MPFILRRWSVKTQIAFLRWRYLGQTRRPQDAVTPAAFSAFFSALFALSVKTASVSPFNLWAFLQLTAQSLHLLNWICLGVGGVMGIYAAVIRLTPHAEGWGRLREIELAEEKIEALSLAAHRLEIEAAALPTARRSPRIKTRL